MPPSDLRTTLLGVLLRRIEQNDPDAADELLRRAGERLERLARQMLRGYPGVRAHEQTADVLQEALLSLLAALRPGGGRKTRGFYRPAAQPIRPRRLHLAPPHKRGGGAAP